jgi:energy-coupling factor transporter ATP-binding protein EcfA2
LLTISELSVKYHGSSDWALRNVELNAEKGDLIVIAGPSGCGKSTLAQTILGLIPFIIRAEKRGIVKIREKALEDIPRNELVQLLGYVPQYPADFTTSLLVSEEVAFPLENLGYSQQEIQSRLQIVFDQLDISHLKFKLITELSSGELQRVALATAIALTPPILILDEPMARIDPKSEIKIARILKELAERGQLILAFEHRLDYIITVANKLIFLDEGKIDAQGSPREVLETLKGVDIPEVSEISIKNENKRPINIQEAVSLLQARSWPF